MGRVLRAYLSLLTVFFMVFTGNASDPDSCTVYLRFGGLRKKVSVFDYDKLLIEGEEYSAVRLRLKAGSHSFSDNLRPGKTLTCVLEKDSVYFLDYRHAPFNWKHFEFVSEEQLLKSKQSGEFFRNRLPDENRRHIHTFNDNDAIGDTIHRLRDRTAKLLASGKPDSIRELLDLQLCDEWKTGVFSVYDLYSQREKIVFDFILGNYPAIIDRLHYFDDYFEQGGFDIDFMDWDERSLLYGFADTYLSYDERVSRQIESAELSREEKELLKLYWKGILIYLKSEEELPETLSESGSDFVRSFPGSSYKPFVARNFITTRKVFVKDAFVFRFDYGVNTLSAGLQKYLTPKYDFDLIIGYELKRHSFLFGYSQSGFGSAQNAPVYDTIDAAMGKMRVQEIAYEYGYAVVDLSKADLSLSLGVRIGNLRHPDFSDSLNRNIARFYVGAGISFVLLPNLHPKYTSGYFTGLDEEVHRSFADLRLCLRAVYSPGAFDRSLGLNGAVTTFSLGLKYSLGSRHPVYRRSSRKY